MPRISIADLDKTEKGPGGDMNLYFSSTYVRVKSGSKPAQWAKYLGYKSNGHNFQVEGGDIQVFPTHSEVIIEWGFPTGWYNTNHSAVFAERVPKRQYSKGISHSNMAFVAAQTIADDVGMFNTKDEKVKELLACIRGTDVQWSPGTFKKMYEDNYPEYEEAYILMKARKVFARALSRDFALLPHPESKDLIIFCHDAPVAELLTKNKIKMLTPEFKPECLAFFLKEGVAVV